MCYIWKVSVLFAFTVTTPASTEHALLAGWGWACEKISETDEERRDTVLHALFAQQETRLSREIWATGPSKRTSTWQETKQHARWWSTVMYCNRKQENVEAWIAAQWLQWSQTCPLWSQWWSRWWPKLILSIILIDFFFISFFECKAWACVSYVVVCRHGFVMFCCSLKTNENNIS